MRARVLQGAGVQGVEVEGTDWPAGRGVLGDAEPEAWTPALRRGSARVEAGGQAGEAADKGGAAEA